MNRLLNILNVLAYLRPSALVHATKGDGMFYSVFFLMLGILGRARGIILHLAEQERAIQASASRTTV